MAYFFQVYAKTTTAGYDDDDSYDQGYNPAEKKTAGYKTTTASYGHHHRQPTTYAQPDDNQYDRKKDTYLDEAAQQPNIITIHQNHTRETDLVLRLVQKGPSSNSNN